jgi:hypothetical protein
MNRNDTPEDLMGYAALQDAALRGVVRAALARAADPRGLPGHHHFYITFKTRAPRVAIPEELRSRYPDEMTIVLQHQYWDLTPGDAAFSVTLLFGGQPKSLSIPYAAITQFHDPAVSFTMHFDTPAAEPLPAQAAADTQAEAEARAEALALAEAQAKALAESRGRPVVTLAEFRKK